MVPLIWFSSKNLRLCAQGRRTKGGERGEQTTRVKGVNEAVRADGASRAAGRRSARTRRGEEERETHKVSSFVIWPMSIGMVPLIFSLYKYLRVSVAQKEGRDM